MVVLYETFANAEIRHRSLTIAFEEKSTHVAENLGLDDQDIIQWSLDSFHERSTSENLLLQHLQKIGAVAVLHRLANRFYLFRGDIAVAVSDFLRTGDHEPLPILERLYEERSIHERLVSAC